MGRSAETPSGLIILLAAGLLAAGLLAACQPDETPAAQPPAPTQAAAPASAPVNPDPGVRTYVCENGETIEAGYPSSDSAVIKRGGRPYPLTAAVAASGVRYVGFGLQWWTKGQDEARLSQLKPGEQVASDPGVLCRTPESAPVQPPAPGTPGGLPDDRTPISEAPFTPERAQGAANVVQTYYALIGEKKYAQARQLWSDGGRASGLSPEAFAADLERYASYNAQVGAPGAIEGAAGSLYVETPVVVYARLRTGEEVHRKGVATLRRVNDVPGSTPEQRRWHIARIELAASR